MFDIEALLKTLAKHEVDFVILEGLAAVVHGSAYVTGDIDFSYARDQENLQRLVCALAPFRPRLRGAPETLPFQFDAATLHAGLNFTLTTELGDIDMLGEIAGFGSYRDIVANSETIELYGGPCRVLTLDGLIRAKRAAGCEKDLRLIPELEALKALKAEEGSETELGGSLCSSV